MSPFQPEPSEEVAKAGFSKSLDDCERAIREAFPLVEAEFCAAHPDLCLHVDYTYRSPATQFELFKKGRTEDATGQWVLTNRAERVTDKDGTVKKGKHNFYPSKAADIYIKRGDKFLWGTNPEEQALYVMLAEVWKNHGIASGALWNTFKDWPHIEVA